MNINSEERSISNCQHHQINNYCRNCGLYLHANKALKTHRYDTHCQISSHKYLQQITKRATQVCFVIRQLTDHSASLLQSICDKFQFTLQTLALGVYYYQYLHSKEEKQKIQHKMNKNNTNSTRASSRYLDQTFYTSTCLIIAAKAIQLDKKVPYLNRYQRYADKNHTKQEYETEQRVICETLNYNFQFTTFITFLNFFMTSGILFQSDNISNFQVALIEDQINRKAKQMILTGNFVKYEPKKLAISIIMDTRKKYCLDPMNKELKVLTGYEESYEEEEVTILKPIKTQRQFNAPSIFESKYNTFRAKRPDIFKGSGIKQNSYRQFQLYSHRTTHLQSGLTKSMSVLRPVGNGNTTLGSHMKQSVGGKNNMLGNIGNYLISKRR